MKKNDGFTLIEITISIAMLAFISVVVIKLFVAANAVNEQSMITDTATLLLTNELEKISTITSTSDLDASFSSSENGFYKEVYLSKDFVPAKNEISYMLQVSLLKEKDGLYKINAYFDDLTGENSRTLVDINSYHFFRKDREMEENE